MQPPYNLVGAVTPPTHTPLGRQVGFYVEPRSVRHYFANGEHWNPNSADDYMPYLTTCEKYAEDPIDAAAQV